MYIVKRDGINLERMNENGETFLKYIQNIFWRFSCPLLSLPKPKGRDCKKSVFSLNFFLLFLPQTLQAIRTPPPGVCLPCLVTLDHRQRHRGPGEGPKEGGQDCVWPPRQGQRERADWTWYADDDQGTGSTMYIDLTHKHLELWKVLMPPRRMESQQTSNK